MAAEGAERGDRRRWLRWAAVLAWALFVLGLGSGGFSADSTSRFLRPLLEWLMPGLEPQQLRALHFGVRKAAHVVEYGVLALLAWRAARQDLARLASGALTLGLALAVAIVDEARQATLASRSGSPADVVLDVAGACLALGLLYALRALRRRAAPAGG